MIAFSCKDCGRPMVAQDAQTGAQATCPACSRAVVIPEGSEADILLLRGREGNSEVVPVRREEAVRRVEAGELKGNHPVWHQGEWVGLDDVLALLAKGETSSAAARQIDQEPELHEIIGPLEPIDLTEAPPEPDDAPPPPADTKPTRRERGGGSLKRVIQVLVILAAIAAVSYRLKLFQKVKMPSALPSLSLGGGGFTGTDIGSPKIKGSKSGNASAMTLTAAGSDIWAQADQCHFAYQRASGDMTLRVRVDSLTETHEWSKAGVMIREDLNGNGRQISIVVTPKNGASLQIRDVPNGECRSTHRGKGVFKAPYWLQLERAGNRFRGSVSKDGAKWEQLGEYTATFKPEVLAGFCLASHDAGKTATAKFSSFSLTQSQQKAGPQPGPKPGPKQTKPPAPRKK
ncbi:MAG: DUF1349 domain-containing protein [Lentisphaeria bacterium]|nr:DUF1349 domain-containing protein [Lentisphaeria bacterium]